MSTLRGKRVLVTGGTGFVGSRLAARLVQVEGASVVATGRNLEAVSHLEDLGVNLRRAHLLDFNSLREMLEGVDVVFHAAAWLGPRHGPPADAWALNVYASEQLARFAAAAGVSRLVHVSSIAAYSPPSDKVIDEDTPLDTGQRSEYGRTKAEGELQAMEAATQTGLELVVARPGIIYGPGSYGWSRRMVRLVQRGVPVIFGDGAGHAHPVYIGNLLDGLVLTATKPQAPGEAFNFVDRPVSWREWFGYYGHMCGRTPRSLPLWLARLALLVAERLPLGLSINRNLLSHYTNRSVYPIDCARDGLDYEPGVSLEEGMARTESWLRQEQVL